MTPTPVASWPTYRWRKPLIRPRAYISAAFSSKRRISIIVESSASSSSFGTAVIDRSAMAMSTSGWLRATRTDAIGTRRAVEVDRVASDRERRLFEGLGEGRVGVHGIDQLGLRSLQDTAEARLTHELRHAMSDHVVAEDL